MFVFYEIVISLISIFALPIFFIFLIRSPHEWRDRLGLRSYQSNHHPSLWIHAASVGEVNGIVPFLKNYALCHPDFHFYLSTTSKTGLERITVVGEKIGVSTTCFLLPLDIPWIVHAVVKKTNPQCLIISETELWPCLLHSAYKRGIPIIMINGRITEKSLRSYRKFPYFFSQILSCFTAFAVQSEKDAQRFATYTDRPIRVTGNLKFALELSSINRENFIMKWGISAPFVITFGSSRPGEEAELIRAHQFLIKKHVSHQIICAPRHLSRLPEIKKLFDDQHMNYCCLSEYTNQNYDILLIDKMGVLTTAYALCNLAIIGGSFYDFGGHNPLEAAYFGKPIIIGPHHSSCEESVLLLQKKQGILVADRKELPSLLWEMSQDNATCVSIGHNAKTVMNEQRIALDRTIAIVEHYV